MNTKKKIVIAVYIISLVMILAGGTFRTMILFDWSLPLLPQALVMLAGGEYFDRMDLPFEYLGSARVNDEEVGLADWRSIQYDYADRQQWTFVCDSREEFEERFEKHGIEGKLVRDFDFENNILLLSYTRPIHSVGISERNRMWKDELPYVYADFTYQAECETNVMYYQALPRVELNFKKGEKIETYPLHIYDTPYEERENPEYGDGQLRRVDGDRLFPKWGWAVEKVNTIR
jgi:hypothetical protein